MIRRGSKAGTADPGHDLPRGYSDVEVIGSGAGGVCRARQDRFDRTVALQILPAARADEATRREFDDACRAMGDLSRHPNVVSVYDAGLTQAGRPFVAMEYCAGGSLRDHLAANGPLTVAEATAIGLKLASALNAVHRRGLVHGAVEPGTVLLTDFGEPVLAGTGLAALTRATAADDLRDASRLVHAAPEVLEGGEPSAGSDVYSLGATLYTLLAGRPAYAAEAAAGLAPLVQGVLRAEPPPMPRPDVPAELLAALRTAMAADPARRFGSVQKMRHALAAAVVPASAAASGTGIRAGRAITVAELPVDGSPVATPAPAEPTTAEPATAAGSPATGSPVTRPAAAEPATTEPATAAGSPATGSPVTRPAPAEPATTEPATAAGSPATGSPVTGPAPAEPTTAEPATAAGSPAATPVPAEPAHAGQAERPVAAGRPARSGPRRSALIVAAVTFAGLVMAAGAGLGARSVVPPERVQPPQPVPSPPAATVVQRAPELSKLDQSRYQPRNLRARPAARQVLLAWDLPADSVQDGAAVIVRQEPATGTGLAALPRVGGALPRSYEAAGLQAGREYCFLVEVLLQRAGGSPTLARSGPVCTVPR